MAVQFNNISEELRSKIPQLEPNQTIQFRLLGYHSVVAEEENGGVAARAVMPNSHTIKMRERIYDPGAKKHVEIAYITGTRPGSVDGRQDEVPVFGTVEFKGSEQGVITLTGQPKDSDLLMRLALSNENKDCVNPAHERPLLGYTFEMIKPEVTAKQTRELRNKKLQAAAIIEEATPEEFGLLVQRLGVPQSDGMGRAYSEDELANRLSDIADADPTRVIKASTDETTRILKVIREAVNNKVIEYNTDETEVLFSSTKEKITDTLAGRTAEESLLTYFLENRQAEKTFPQIVKLNNAANEKRKPRK